MINRLTPQGTPSGDGVLDDRAEVELRTRTSPSAVARYAMPTDAMKGEIEPGTPLDISHGDGYDGPGIYMLLVDGFPDVAYLQRRPGGGWRIAYANPAYQDANLIPDDTGEHILAAETGLPVELKILGRVRGSYKMH